MPLFVLALQNKVYKYPDLMVCPYVQYGCDAYELEADCVASAWETEGGPPDAVFYPRETLDQLHQTTTDELQIRATGYLTDQDEVGLPAPRHDPYVFVLCFLLFLYGVAPMEARLASLPGGDTNCENSAGRTDLCGVLCAMHVQKNRQYRPLRCPMGCYSTSITSPLSTCVFRLGKTIAPPCDDSNVYGNHLSLHRSRRSGRRAYPDMHVPYVRT